MTQYYAVYLCCVLNYLILYILPLSGSREVLMHQIIQCAGGDGGQGVSKYKENDGRVLTPVTCHTTPHYHRPEVKEIQRILRDRTSGKHVTSLCGSRIR